MEFHDIDKKGDRLYNTVTNRGVPRSAKCKMIITFIGHSFVSSHDRIKKEVKERIRKIGAGAEKITCYLGGYGAFDEICACACRELKKENERVEVVYITPYFSLSEQEKIKEMQRRRLYDATVYPPIENVPLRFAVLKRNEWMIKNADLIIAYVDHTYGGLTNHFKRRFEEKRK